MARDRDDREPHERWFARGTGVGLLIGAVLGLLLGDIMVGLMVGVILGSGIGVLTNPNTRRDDRDRDRPRRRRDDEDAAIDRGVLWLLVGLGVAALLAVATAPELLEADVGQLGGLLAVVLAAAVPGVAIVAVVAYRRRSRPDDEEA